MGWLNSMSWSDRPVDLATGEYIDMKKATEEFMDELGEFIHGEKWEMLSTPEIVGGMHLVATFFLIDRYREIQIEDEGDDFSGR